MRLGNNGGRVVLWVVVVIVHVGAVIACGQRNGGGGVCIWYGQ